MAEAQFADAPKFQVLDLLLVGRTGNGKSSTGNSILGDTKFIPSSTRSTTPPTIKHGTKLVEDCYLVNVVDGIELPDMGVEDSNGISTAAGLADDSFLYCSEGFSALLIVLRYGVRFTRQEKDAIQTIRSLFKKNVMKSHGIIIMTHGDNFEQDVKDDRVGFDDWCKDQIGDVKALYEETGGRWVLFDNKTKDEEKMEHQVKELLGIVKQIQDSSDRIIKNDLQVCNKWVKISNGELRRRR